MRWVRGLLVAAGAGLAAYGAWLLLGGGQTLSQLEQVAVWAAAAVVVHDALLAPFALAVGWLVQRLLPSVLARPAAYALVILGTVTVAAFAVLTRTHQGAGNSTLLDRDYPLGLLFVMLGVGGGVAVTAVLGRMRRSRGWRG